MNIYFAGSIRGGRDDAAIYQQIISLLGQFGTVLTEHVGSATLTDKGEHEKDSAFIYQRDMAWLRAADVLVAEVTQPSLGVGYELGQAEAMGKKIICLWRQIGDRGLSSMVAGNGYKKLSIIPYSSVEDLPELLAQEFATVQA